MIGKKVKFNGEVYYVIHYAPYHPYPFTIGKNLDCIGVYFSDLTSEEKENHYLALLEELEILN